MRRSAKTKRNTNTLIMPRAGLALELVGLTAIKPWIRLGWLIANLVMGKILTMIIVLFFLLFWCCCFLSWLFFYVIACLPSVAHAFVFPISRIIPCQNVGTCTVPEAHNPENITIVDLCEEDNSNNIGLWHICNIMVEICACQPCEHLFKQERHGILAICLKVDDIFCG